MSRAPKYIEELIESLTKFPGIGRKGAERIAYFIVKSEKSFSKNLIDTLTDVNDKLDICPISGMIILKGEESAFSDKNRNSEFLCVVENMEDAIKIENTNSFDGSYHVLGGSISPLDGIGPSDLNIESLVQKVQSGAVKEVIMALSTTMEGDTTNFYIFKKLKDSNVKLSVIARGISIGDELEYTDEVTLGRSILNRTPYENSLD